MLLHYQKLCQSCHLPNIFLSPQLPNFFIIEEKTKRIIKHTIRENKPHVKYVINPTVVVAILGTRNIEKAPQSNISKIVITSLLFMGFLFDFGYISYPHLFSSHLTQLFIAVHP